MLKLLDCTLRDGGYVNNWNFSDSDILYILNKLIKSKVDIIEIGYFDPFNGEEFNSTKFKSLTNLKQRFNLIEDQNVVVMINCDFNIIERLPDQNKTLIKGIRLAFHRGQIKEIQSLAANILSKGYEVYLNPMVTSFYSEKEINELINISNQINPVAIYIVDSFGSIDFEQIKFIKQKFIDALDNKISIGFHPHNNLQLAFSNSINFICLESSNDQIIDCSVLGMGRGAGNLNTELIVQELNKRFDKNYEFKFIVDIIETKIKFYNQKYQWGYNLSYLFSGINNCHPNYSKYLLDLDRFNYNEMNYILSSLEENEKIRYDKKIIRNKVENLKPSLQITNYFEIKGEEILLIGPGLLNKFEIDAVNSLINQKKIISVSLNNKSEIDTDYYFFSNTKRLDEFFLLIEKFKIIVTESLSKSYKDKVLKVINDSNKIPSNSFTLFIEYLINKGFKKVYVAGVDGYSKDINYSFNYSKKGNSELIEKEINFTRKFLDQVKNLIKIEFITQSRYKIKKIVGVIPARYASSRFNGKPLAKINGVEMLKRTFNQVNNAKLIQETYVATDSKKILEFCNKEKINCVLTANDCLTGTDRIINFSENYDADIYINIQGDEPVIDPRSIDDLIKEIEKDNEYDVFNMYKQIEDESEKNSSSIIKVAVNEKNELLYMSRANIPSNKSNDNKKLLKQVCVYGFRKSALNNINYNKKSKNEKIEDIEILRFIESNIKVKMIETNYSSISVDHPSDIFKVESFLKKKKNI